MAITWKDGIPIYRQVRQRVIAMMLDGTLSAGDALPSVRQLAAECEINPLTVSKAYQELVDEDLVEKRRGLGMFVTAGACTALRKSERRRFLEEEWPAMVRRIERLQLDPAELLAALDKNKENAP